MQSAGKKYNQMAGFNQNYFHNDPAQSNQGAKDGSAPLGAPGGQQATPQPGKLPHHHVQQSYSFDYRQPQQNTQAKIPPSQYASIGSMNNNGTQGGMSTGPDGMTGKMSGSNHNRLQGILNEGASKKVNPSLN